MDFVYICRDGDNEELRYSIRSVVHSFPDANIWVIGGKPDWYIGNYICVDQSRRKYINALANLNALVNSPDISKEFILMNDDFFILQKIKKIDNFNGGLLQEKINNFIDYSQISFYTKKMILTKECLINNGISDPIDYELHVPMIMEKRKLKSILKYKDKILWRSFYGNIYKVKSTTIKDVKIYTEQSMKELSYKYDDDSVYISTDDRSFISMLNILDKKFPTKTLFEKN
jgi:hypothetical protein